MTGVQTCALPIYPVRSASPSLHPLSQQCRRSCSTDASATGEDADVAWKLKAGHARKSSLSGPQADFIRLNTSTKAPRQTSPARPPLVGDRYEYICPSQPAFRLHGIPKKTESYTNQAPVNMPCATS